MGGFEALLSDLRAAQARRKQPPQRAPDPVLRRLDVAGLRTMAKALDATAAATRSHLADLPDVKPPPVTADTVRNRCRTLLAKAEQAYSRGEIDIARMAEIDCSCRQVLSGIADAAPNHSGADRNAARSHVETIMAKADQACDAGLISSQELLLLDWHGRQFLQHVGA